MQLRTRHWIITDGDGHVEEVQGEGVVGEQPVLGPGQTFSYTSGCPLPTPFGTMRGTYRMVSQRGEEFDVRIAEFTLSEPYTYTEAEAAPQRAALKKGRRQPERFLQQHQVAAARDLDRAELFEMRRHPLDVEQA